ncbi:MAG TPA: heavy metal-binding domain-containing protein, partial [Gammaproteobacteria bacterium]|nr:heavy metal-binding domain-containing protein [Gammaproteobacteria bacterium]
MNVANLAKDPVCGMTVSVASGTHSVDHQGRRFHFCSAGCRDRFVADPGRHVDDSPQPLPAASRGKWTCPMHPEIVRDAPGDCPICGMALEPLLPDVEANENPELRALSRRLWIAVPLTAALLFITMGDMLPGLDFAHWLGGAYGWVQFALTTPVMLYCGSLFFRRGWRSLRGPNFNMWTL